ncbi:MAG: 30S ribosomal protein S21 [Candidatus Goldbacteria bacterium]|jgi:small subunit ribosomal protein S21|nr:30S ribosomal protein S21 [Candidatus Goldiibacteriota bacterium]PKL90966.1 MAG: 30S ribosomal protein S21 [Candidatus Goldiibacteriota bacterium HGW-Goldbacteria-1]
MAEISIKENESLDDAMKRFKKKVQDAGILQEMKKREYYEPPSVRKKQKMWAASKKRKKKRPIKK